MTDTFTFLGELELAGDRVRNPEFADFEALPLVEFIRAIAGEFASSIELMPYQKDGDMMRLLVSVYLQPKNTKNKVIAVLIREAYPADTDELLRFVERASTRLKTLSVIADRFEESSVKSAEESLNRLLFRLKSA